MLFLCQSTITYLLRHLTAKPLRHLKLRDFNFVRLMLSRLSS